MTRRPPPLRFLALVVGGWVCLRAAILAPSWWVEPVVAAPAAAPLPVVSATEAEPAAPQIVPPVVRFAYSEAVRADPGTTRREQPLLTGPVNPVLRLVPAQWVRSPPLQEPPPSLAAPQPERVRYPGRWSGSAWLLMRGAGAGPLAPGGSLGGSQAGMRLAYRLNGDQARPISLSARLYSPLRRRSGAEAAVGIDWRPAAALPLNILAERRQALGSEGRSAFALTFYGGISERPIAGGFRLDAYAQAGVVGTRSRDLFADGAARITTAAGPLRIGAGLWGGAQPGVSRLDAGPHVSLRLPGLGANVRVSAEYRFRITGEASPGSGPALTIGSDF